MPNGREKESHNGSYYCTTLSTRHYLIFDQFTQLKKKQKIRYAFFKHQCKTTIITHLPFSLFRKELILFFFKYFLVILDRVLIVNTLFKCICASTRTIFFFMIVLKQFYGVIKIAPCNTSHFRKFCTCTDSRKLEQIFSQHPL